MITLRVLLFVLVALLLCRPVRAEVSPATTPVAIEILRDLPKPDVELLVKLQRDAPSDKEIPKLRQAFQRLANVGGWQPATVMAHMDPAAFEKLVAGKASLFASLQTLASALEWPPDRLTKLAARLASERPSKKDQKAAGKEVARNEATEVRCKLIADELERLLKGEAVDAPITRDLATRKTGPKKVACLDNASLFDKTEILTIVAGEGDEVRVLSGGSFPRYFRLGKADAYHPRDENDHRVVYFTPLPRDVPVVVRLQKSTSEIPLVWSFISNRHITLDASSTARGCLDVSVSPRTDNDAIFFDGVEILTDRGETNDVVSFLMPRTADKDRGGEHEVVVVRSREVVYRRPIPSNHLLDLRCKPVQIDLREVREAQDISVAETRVGATCRAAGIDSVWLATRAESVLVSLRKPPKPFEGWKVISEGESIRQLLLPAPEDHVDPDASPRRPAGALPSGEDELFRKGLGKLISVDLQCAKHGEGSFNYSIVARSFDLSKPTGAKLREGLTTELPVVVFQLRDLRGALRATLAKLLALPYVRFVGGRAAPSFSGPMRFDVETSRSTCAGTGQFELWAAKLGDEEVTSACRGLESAENDHAKGVVRTRLMKLDTQSPEFQAGQSTRTVRLIARVPSSGHYLLRAVIRCGPSDNKVTEGTGVGGRDAPDHGAGSHHAREKRAPAAVVVAQGDQCVEAAEPKLVVSAEFGYGRGWFFAHQDARRGRIDNFSATVGVDYRVSPDLPLWLGLTAGYARTIHRADAAPAWQDLLAEVDAAQTNVSLAWTRHALLLGPTIGARVPLCIPGVPCPRGLRHAQAFYRHSLLLDLGTIDTFNVPLSFNELRRSARGADLDFSMLLQLGISVAAQRELSFHAACRLGLLGLNDLGATSKSRPQAELRGLNNGAVVALGFNIGAEFGP